MNAAPRLEAAPTRLSERPLIHPTAQVVASTLGRYVEIGERVKLNEAEVGDYSYLVTECEVWAAKIGKFANIASHVRINATNHPVWRATLHHFTYRANDYWPTPSARRASSTGGARTPSPSATTSGSGTARRSCPA